LYSIPFRYGITQSIYAARLNTIFIIAAADFPRDTVLNNQKPFDEIEVSSNGFRANEKQQCLKMNTTVRRRDFPEKVKSRPVWYLYIWKATRHERHRKFSPMRSIPVKRIIASGVSPRPEPQCLYRHAV
jgi:hypothetical protein